MIVKCESIIHTWMKKRLHLKKTVLLLLYGPACIKQEGTHS
jgi:hypothetical protein